MHVISDSFAHGGVISTEFALAEHADPGPVSLSGNRNPQLTWSDVPARTTSFVVTCVDSDCPSAPDDVNQPDREVPDTLERVDFVHWLLADVPGDVTEIAEGSHSSGVTAHGKSEDVAPKGVHGVNDYTAWFSGDPEMEGEWHGYDGPAPPWNDSIVHRYEFTVYAMDVPSLGLPPGFTLDDLTKAMSGHVLGSASITGTYSTNPRLI